MINNETSCSLDAEREKSEVHDTGVYGHTPRSGRGTAKALRQNTTCLEYGHCVPIGQEPIPLAYSI
jgi:hypothetical protein